MGVRQGLVVDEPLPAFGSGPLLLILAIAPAVFAVGAVLFGQAPTAAGVLIGAALLSPGLALVDAQFISDALEASRPELMVPPSLAAVTPASGAYILLAGHLVTALAGLLAVGRAGADPDSDYFAALDATASATGRRRAVGWALAAGALSVVGLLLPPFRSDNAFIVARDLIASPSLVMYGGLLIALTVLMGGVAAAADPRPPMARGIAIGLFLALAWLVVPQLAAIAAVDWLHFERGAPLLALLPVGLLAVVLFFSGSDTAEQKEITLDASPLHVVTGVLGVLTGAATLFGAFGALLVVNTGGDQPESYANRQLLPAGILIILLGAGLFTRWAGAVRPAFVIALGAVAVVGLASLDAAFTGTAANSLSLGMPVAVTDYRVGAAAWFVVAALVLAGAAAVVAVVAGGAERDDVDLSRRVFHTRYAVPAGGAVLFAIGAFASPMIKAPGFTAPGIFTEFRLTSWGLLIGLVVVVAAAVIAALARPARAAALLLGAAIVAGVHLLEFPMTSDRAADAQPGTGTWLSLACLVALLVASVAAATDPSRHEEAE
ncbi:hypothetical protein [Actinophytocola sp.]|uniref:hypothetical protein n=1 Tax=Actinophytocola sp. TaxID=1872138 RepID=UPI002ED5A27C